MKPHGWLSWYISYFAQGKVNNWMSKYLPVPLLGKSGHGLHHSWKNGSNCEESEVTKENTFCIWDSIITQLTQAFWEHSKGPSDLALSPRLILSPASLLLLIGLKPHTLSLVLKLQAFQWLSFHSESTLVLHVFWSQLRRLWGIQAPFTYIFLYLIPIFYRLPPIFKKWCKSRDWLYFGGLR